MNRARPFRPLRHHTRATVVVCTLLSLFVLPSATRALGQYSGPPTSADKTSGVLPTPDQSALFPSTPDTLLTSGDVVTVRLFGDSEYNVNARIGVDGNVMLPLIGLVQLQGLNVTQAQERIAQMLEQAGMYRNPQVIITLAEGPSAIITLAGEMHGVVPVVGSRSLFAVLSSGGGLPNGASRTLTILRPGRAQPIIVDIGNDPLHSAAGNIPVFPGDTVIVSRIGVVYVMGEFRNPGVVPITNYGPLTLTQVSATVGGPVWDAKYSGLHIIRTVGDHRTVTTLNIKDVLYGKAPDPIMQPNDIVFLPPSAFKSSISNGSLGSILGLVSFALATFYTIR